MTDTSDRQEGADLPATETVRPQSQQQSHPPTAAGAGWDLTQTVTGGPGTGGLPAPLAGGPAVAAAPAGAPEIRRYGPGVPSAVVAAQGVLSAEQVWRLGQQQPAPARRRKRPWRLGGVLLSAALIIASGVTMWLRLHHPPFGVTGAAITGQAKSGCAVDVTGRISTTGGAGTLSYEWVFSSQGSAQPTTQPVAAGQTAVYLTAAVQGQGHGTVQEQVTLRVLGPGEASAATRVALSC